MQSLGKVAHVAQPESFVFTDENRAQADKVIARYPAGRQRSAVMPLLSLAQEQCGGWLPKAAMDYVADILEMAPIRVYEVATFYTMYNLEPVGKHFVQVCTTTPCWLRGSETVVDACKKHLGVGLGETSADGQFTLIEVECLGACVNAPMMQIGNDYYEDLDAEKTVAVLTQLASGGKPQAGPQNGRLSSEPSGMRASRISSPQVSHSAVSNAESETEKSGSRTSPQPNGPADTVGKPHVDKKDDAAKEQASGKVEP